MKAIDKIHDGFNELVRVFSTAPSRKAAHLVGSLSGTFLGVAAMAATVPGLEGFGAAVGLQQGYEIGGMMFDMYREDTLSERQKQTDHTWMLLRRVMRNEV